MNIVVLVNGREAIPIRAIPHMADSTVSAEILVRGLLCSDNVNVLHGLSAYELLEYEVCRKVRPVEWRRVAVALRALSEKLGRQELNEELTHAEVLNTWKRESVKLLPHGVFIWKDEFFLEHFKRFRRLSNEELAQNYSDFIELNRQLISAPDDSYTAELITAQGAPENWRELFQAGMDEADAEGPFNPGNFCVYVPTTCEPKDTDTLYDVTFSPLIEQNEIILVMQGFEHVPKAGPKIDERQSSSVESGDQHQPSATIEGPAPDRFKRRDFEYGFNKIEREKSGERNFEAKRGAGNLSEQRCIELALKTELGITDWIELTGVGIGEFGGFFLVATDGVSFIKHAQDFIKDCPPEWQIDMLRDNLHEPLKFPSTPARILDFIDSELCTIRGCFSVPDAFRLAVTNAKSTHVAPSEASKKAEKTPRRRVHKIHAILQSFLDAGIGKNIESVWVHICDNAGKPNFPFKGRSVDTAVHVDGEKYAKSSMERSLRTLLKAAEKN